jgi:hypothetical protein
MEFAGLRRTFELFRTEIIDYVKNAQARNRIIPIEKFVLKASVRKHRNNADYDLQLTFTQHNSQAEVIAIEKLIKNIKNLNI